jgi:hypothetical protein
VSSTKGSAASPGWSVIDSAAWLLTRIAFLVTLTRGGWAQNLEYQARETVRVHVPSGPIVTVSQVHVKGWFYRREPLGAATGVPPVILDGRSGKGWLLMQKLKQYLVVHPGELTDGSQTVVLSTHNIPQGESWVGKVRCVKYTLGKYAVWIDPKTGIQMRRETKTPAGFKMTVDYDQVELVPQASDWFTLPKDFKETSGR